jgi:hypothetical protein
MKMWSLIRHCSWPRREEVTLSSHGPLDMPKLAAMLLQDVALMVQRPGSWEGANMAQVMSQPRLWPLRIGLD